MNSTSALKQTGDHRALALEFQERGFLMIPNALSGAQISELNRVVDRDLEKHGDAWVKFDESLMETPDVISRTAHALLNSISPSRTPLRSESCATSSGS